MEILNFTDQMVTMVIITILYLALIPVHSNSNINFCNALTIILKLHLGIQICQS